MSIPVPLRRDFKGSELRALARKTKDGPQARRLLTLAAIYDGATRTEAARIGGVTLQIIRDWVMRFNARGAAGLLVGISAPQKGRIRAAPLPCLVGEARHSPERSRDRAALDHSHNRLALHIIEPRGLTWRSAHDTVDR